MNIIEIIVYIAVVVFVFIFCIAPFSCVKDEGGRKLINNK